MIVVQDVVELELVSGSETSIRMKLTSDMINSISLEWGDYAQVYILGIFKEPNTPEPIPVNLPMIGKVTKRGGASLGITIKPKLVKRLEIKETYELLISIEKVKKGSS